MKTGTTDVARGAERVASLVDAYTRRTYAAVLEQHPGASVSSPLGIWLLLAACASGASGEHRTALEEALGCPADEASRLLATVMASPPPALKAAIAVWVAVADATERLAAWVRGLPSGVESGFMPTKTEADAWADRNTLGLIKSFPLQVDAATRVVMASALATRVSWRMSFDIVQARDHLRESSPWRATVKRLLWDGHPSGTAMIVRTEAAGLVAVHEAVAEEDLTVISVSADPAVGREAVFHAAHEVAAFARADSPAPACSLFDLQLGSAHSWEITERRTRTYHAQQRVERIAGVSMPAWQVQSHIDLTASPSFGSAPAIETMREMIGPRPTDECDAVQAAVASFTPVGFEAAAVTGFGVRASAVLSPMHTGLERTAILRFDHPYAALAIAGHPPPRRQPTNTAQARSPFTGMPLFSAWVHEPEEPEDVSPAVPAS
jgi:Serpin (serine protease inhibitor)